jgi:hypothetical protein
MALSNDDIKQMEARVEELSGVLKKKQAEAEAAGVRRDAAREAASAAFDEWIELGKEADKIFDERMDLQHLLSKARMESYARDIEASRRLGLAPRPVYGGSDSDWS